MLEKLEEGQCEVRREVRGWQGPQEPVQLQGQEVEEPALVPVLVLPRR